MEGFYADLRYRLFNYLLIYLLSTYLLVVDHSILDSEFCNGTLPVGKNYENVYSPEYTVA